MRNNKKLLVFCLLSFSLQDKVLASSSGTLSPRPFEKDGDSLEIIVPKAPKNNLSQKYNRSRLRNLPAQKSMKPLQDGLEDEDAMRTDLSENFVDQMMRASSFRGPEDKSLADKSPADKSPVDQMFEEDPSLYELDSSKMSLGSDSLESVHSRQSSPISSQKDFLKIMDQMSRRLKQYESRMALYAEFINKLEEEMLEKKEQLAQIIDQLRALRKDVNDKKISPKKINKSLDELLNFYFKTVADY